MRKIKIVILLIASVCIQNTAKAQTGYYDAPYVRYEADAGMLTSATSTPKSYSQSLLQSEASGQVCVDMTNAGASVEWTLSAEGDGLVVRYSVPDGQSGVLDVYAENVLVASLTLTTVYSWEYLSTNGNQNNAGVVNTNPRMRFDEVRVKLPAKIPVGGSLKLVRQSGAIHLDFAELEAVPAVIPSSLGDVLYTGDGSDLQTFINDNGGATLYLAPGVYNISRELYFGVANTVLKGAGMWYTQLHFTNPASSAGGGGLRANAANISYSDLYLTTVRNSRSNSYKGINGVYTSGSVITNIWAEHFECGAWIGQYNTGSIAYADGFTLSHCRFRNNYADGINLCKGNRNTIVEHCSFRNNGDDDMAIWSSNGLECRNNTYRYNTSENCWRAAGCAIYGGYNNQAHHLLIVDNLEAGLRVNNSFSGVGFNVNGMHEFSDITLLRCGTFNDLFNGPVGAIDIASSNVAGTRVNNVRFKNITITDSKNDAIYIRKKSGEGFYNLNFQNITINGTGREFPYNNVNALNWGRGYGILFVGSPAGNGTYCNITYANIGGNAAANVNNAQIGTFSWTANCNPPSPTFITSSSSAGICDDPIVLSATTTAPSSQTILSVDFLVDNVNKGTDNTAPYSINWSNAAAGMYEVKAVAYYSDGSSTQSDIQYMTVEEGLYTTATAPVIDGTVDAVWNNYAAFSLNKVSVGAVSNAADLSATYKMMSDANYLYVLVEVTDDVLRNDGGANWQKDAVELFFDMGNDKAGTYVANNDYQYSFVWNSLTALAGLEFAQVTRADNLGYVLEIRLPWSTLGGMPASGTFMGVDVHVNDNDTGVRNGKLAWTDGTDNAWQSTSVLGTLQKAGCSNAFIPLSVAESKDIALQLYPNPFHTTATIQLDPAQTTAYSITISDLHGKAVRTLEFSGKESISIGEDLVPGMYLVEVIDGSRNRIVKLIKL